MQRLVTRQGYVKFWRLGPIEFGEQSRWSRAPRSRGLWAFPYPFYDLFFTWHKYMDLIPKNLRPEHNPDLEMGEQEEWVNKVGRKVLPIREFWYRGDLFTHFTPAGEVGDPGLMGDETHWSVMDAAKFARCIASTGANKSFYRNKDTLERIDTSVDHMEVFITPNMGKIRDRL